MNSHKQKPGVRHHKCLGLSKQKLQFWDILVPWTYFWLSEMAKKDNFGHSDQSEVPDNGSNGFPMVQNLGIDTKIKSLALSKPKLQIWSFSGILAFPYLIEIGGAVY